MRITFLGHAGVFIETDHATILCDPWFNPAFFASWFPFPDNGGIDPEAISSPDFLYVSHSHDDHLDARFLAEHVAKDVVVILPDFPTDDHRCALSSLGFSEFLPTHNGRPVDVGGLRLLTHALVAPTDGAIGDSGLAISDGTTTLFNQNDSKPLDLEAIDAFGPYDGHLVQFSGAIWYPMVYRIPVEERRALGRRKRVNQLTRAARFVAEIGATHFFPFAGPPCFLDDELFHLNDFGDDANIFADQSAALAYTRAHGMHNGHLTVPGTVVELVGGRCTVTHPAPDDEALSPFVDKERVLRAYQARARPRIEAEKAKWPRDGVDLVTPLSEWWTPLLADADHTCAGVNGRILLEIADEASEGERAVDEVVGDATAGDAVVVDFLDRRVARWQGEACRYRFRIPRPLVERCVVRREVDWVNALFLSCRFEAERDGPYNEFVYNFFRSLSPARMAYTERYYAELAPAEERWECAGYSIQRRCPHLGADLARFGSVDDGVLTCALHGWRFELATGRCLTADDRRLVSTPLDEEATAPTI